MKLTDGEIREVTKLIELGKPLPDKYQFLLFDDKREVELTDFSVFYSQDSTKKAAESLGNGKSKIVVEKGKRYKIAVKVVDIFGNDTMKIIEVGV